MVPLLKNPPEPQNEFVTRSMAVFVFVSVCQSAPHAWCPLICRGSPRTLSNIRIKVGDRTTASKAVMPAVPFWSNCHPRLVAEAVEAGRAAKSKVVNASEVRIGEGSAGKFDFPRPNVYMEELGVMSVLCLKRWICHESVKQYYFRSK